jgi:hypothetical protein
MIFENIILFETVVSIINLAKMGFDSCFVLLMADTCRWYWWYLALVRAVPGVGTNSTSTWYRPHILLSVATPYLYIYDERGIFITHGYKNAIQ